MLLNESMKSSNTSQFQQNDVSMLNISATNTAGVITASTASAGTSSGTTTSGTPLRSRNNNRDRQQSDDKQDSSNVKGKNPPKPMEEFYKDLQQFHEKRGTPIMHMPKITGRQVDLHRLYCEVTERGGFQKVNMRDEWEDILPELGLKEKIVNGSAALKYIYRRVLEKYECLNYFGEDPDKVDALAAAELNEFNMGGGRGRGSRHPTSYSSSNPTIIHSVAMSYNYRQHHVNMDRRRQFKLSTDLHKASAYEKLMLSLLSPLPNEQDFAINACTLMANETRHTLKLNEFPKLLDALLAHTGVFCDYTMRKLFQHIYSGVRHHSLYGFWYDLLNDRPQILDLYTDEQSLREAALIDDYDDGKPEMEGIWQDCVELDFLNLRTGLGTQDYVGQRVLQVVSILRNLSFQEENLGVLVKNKTFLRFLVMSSNIRWSNVHIQALEIVGNIAGELEILDPTIDDLSRCLMATICDGIEGPDRGVIINCLEILYKLCQKDTNEDYVLKCLNNNFYNTISLFLSLNDIMLLLFTLEAIYALTCLGPKSCHSMMQVKGIIGQLISLITVEAQAYGPDGCILMRVVETVPGNMLPMVAQNIANLQNVTHIQKQNTTVISHNQIKPQILTPNPMPASEISETANENIQQSQQQQQLQMTQNFSHEDEQFALAWLEAKFERTSSVESHIGTQELYGMYVKYCLRSRKYSVIQRWHFPKLVRHVFTDAVGPVTVRKADGTESPGTHYVSIRLRAKPLPFQKTIKKIKQQIETSGSAATTTTAPAVTTTIVPQDNAPTATSVAETVKQEVNPVNTITTQSTVSPVIENRPPTPQLIDEKKEEKMDTDDKGDIPSKLENQTQTTIVQTIPESEPMQAVDSTSVIQILTPNSMPASEITETANENIQQPQQQQQQLQTPQNFTHEDEQFALAWLEAKVERTSSVESHMGTQELYAMYVKYCITIGKNSVVQRWHFPKLVRHIFTDAVGPVTIRKADGTDLPGTHYVSIRLRAKPLPLQKTMNKIKQQKETSVSATTTTAPAVTTCVGTATTVDNALKATSVAETINTITTQSTVPSVIDEKKEEKMDTDEKGDMPSKLENQTHTIVHNITESEPMQVVDSTTVTQPAIAQNPSSSLIKSLLANKVNQRQLKQNSITTSSTPTTVTTSAVPTTTTQPIKVASTAITALVNNPLMQHTPVKVGQTTIKPLNPHATILDKKPQISESTPPPLAPLSGANVAKDASGRPIILANQMLVDILDKKMVDPPIPTSSIIQKRKIDDNMGNNKRLALETSSVVTSTKEEVQVTPSKNAANLYAEMAASILEDEDLEEFSTQPQQQQPSQPQLEQQQIQQTSLIIPAKLQQQQTTTAPLQGVQRQLVFQSNQPQLNLTQPVPTTSQQMPNAMATIKTDQGLQTVPVILQQKPMEMQQQGQTQIIQQMIQPAQQQQQQTYVLATNQQGQTYLVAQQTQPHPPPPPPQSTQRVLVTQTPQQQSTGQKTIIILQQQPMPGQQQQQIITTGPPGQGQKMIMTTSQGQQVLVTQTPQQIFINPQTGTATHIQHVPMQTQTRQIIQSSNPQQQQQPPQQTTQIQAGQISPSLLNQLNQIPATIKLHQPIAQHTTSSPQPQPATITRMNKTVSLVQSSNTPTAPVVIPQLQQHQSIIQQHIISGPTEKRHVILSGGAGTGGVGMRAIEIKETVITQAQQPPQQQQLNSQTIITTQQPPQGTVATPPLLQQQVQQQIRAVIEQQQHPSIIQQKISSFPVVHQQQQQQQQQQPQASSSLSLAQQPQQQHQQPTKTQNPVIVQTNIAASKHKTSLSHQQQQQQPQTPTLKAAKLPDPAPSLIQPKNATQTHNMAHTTTPSIPVTTQSPGLGNIKKPPTLIKPSLPTIKLPNIVNTVGPPPLATVNTTAAANNSTANAQSAQTSTTTAGTSTPTTSTTTTTNSAPSAQPQNNQNPPQLPTQPQPQPQLTNAPLPITTQPQQPLQQITPIDAQWLYICDWRNCPRKKFKSIGDLQHHVCTSHAPDHLDPAADIFCQWGVGPGLCDGVPRKRFSLMTHLLDHHLTLDSLRTAVQRRIATGIYNITPATPPVTIVRNNELSQRTNNASPSPSNSSSSSSQTQSITGPSALQAINRHTNDLTYSKELLDENEGPVTKSIRLTAALILRNLVTYTSTAKRSIRRYEPHLTNIALSNVESSGTIAHILYEMNG